MTRYAARVDNSHAEIREAIRKAGYFCWDCSKYGGGFPDLLPANHDGDIFLFEVKSPGEKLTRAEIAFHSACGIKNLHVIFTAEEAIGYLEA